MQRPDQGLSKCKRPLAGPVVFGGESGIVRPVPGAHPAMRGQLRCPNSFQTNLSNPRWYLYHAGLLRASCPSPCGPTFRPFWIVPDDPVTRASDRHGWRKCRKRRSSFRPALAPMGPTFGRSESFQTIQSRPLPIEFSFCGGRGGIRTHGWLPIAGFQDQCNRPLCHPSNVLQFSHATRGASLMPLFSAAPVSVSPSRRTPRGFSCSRCWWLPAGAAGARRGSR